MYQRDYILRMIEMIGEFIARVLGLIRNGELGQASEQLGKIYNDMLKKDAVFFRSIPANELTKKLLKEHNYTNGHLEILAELFNAEAELELAQGNRSGCIEYFEKSLLLFEFLDREGKTYSREKHDRMIAIRNRIEELKQG